MKILATAWTVAMAIVKRKLLLLCLVWEHSFSASSWALYGSVHHHMLVYIYVKENNHTAWTSQYTARDNSNVMQGEDTDSCFPS